MPEQGLRERYEAGGVLDYGTARHLLQTDELIEKTVRQVYEDMDRNADEMEKLLAEGDIENFTIRVHALKSSARMIGATALSERARKLELLGNRAVGG